MSNVLDAALKFVEKGKPVFPCGPDKKPLTKHGFKDATIESVQISAWWTEHPNANPAMPTGEASDLVVLDVDQDSTAGKDGESSLGKLIEEHGPLPATLTVRTPRGGRHIFFQYPGERVPNSASSLGTDLDVRGDGGYVLLPPSKTPVGEYAWIDRCKPAPLPSWLRALVVKSEALKPAKMPSRPAGDIDLERIRRALNFIDPEPQDDWLKVGMALHTHFGESGWAIFDEWSQRAPNYDAAENRKRWDSFTAQNGVGIGTLFHLAKENGFSERPEPKVLPFELVDDDEPLDEENRDRDCGGASVAEQLVQIASEHELFRDPEGGAFIEVKRSSGPEVMRLRSGRFNEWLAATYFGKARRVARKSVIEDARAVIAGLAEESGKVHPVHLRVGDHDGRVLVDLADGQKRAVEIRPGAWRLVENPPVKFLRSAKALALPEPQSAGRFDQIWQVLNVRERDRVLCAGWLLSSLQPKGPFFHANFVGEQGTGKSFACRVLRSLIDPSSIPLRRGTTEERSLWVAAANNRVLAFENLSSMPAWLSDALCALATGGGYSSRALWTDGDEAAFSAQRPVLLNGIVDVVLRPDLAERTLRLELERIPAARRRTEEDLNREFEQMLPGLLGALLDAVADGLRRLPDFRLEELPRMADATRWIEACLPSLGFEQGAFVKALARHERESADAAIDGSPVARGVVAFMRDKAEWCGTAGDLSDELKAFLPEAETKVRYWPGNPRAMAGVLRRMAPALRRVGLEVEEPQSTDKTRTYQIVNEGVTNQSPRPPRPPKERDSTESTGDSGGLAGEFAIPDFSGESGASGGLGGSGGVLDGAQFHSEEEYV